MKTTWRIRKEEEKKEELKALLSFIFVAILFLLSAKYGN
jgi:hypothetical protein